ncbi:MAG: hypothetical protein B7Y95_17485 [Rhizobiales bacterium 32-66-11]|jgi:hypothetical protein|nr:MAG: hypothetical protein B7Y95_17485 [Rhizobiales bacterium 32-66-11]
MTFACSLGAAARGSAVRRAAVLPALAALLALAAGSAHASSPAAWAELEGKARAACLAASGLAKARVEGAPVMFAAHVLVLVKGRWPQPHMKNQAATFACLYDSRAGTAEAQEWSAAPK